MRATVRLKLNPKGVRELMRSPEAEAELLRRARRVAAAAGDGNVVDSGRGKNRARAAVITASPAARRREAERRSLTRAIDAARG